MKKLVRPEAMREVFWVASSDLIHKEAFSFRLIRQDEGKLLVDLAYCVRIEKELSECLSRLEKLEIDNES